MALIRSVRGYSPKWERDCWFAENATIIGEVTMGEECTVWYGAVLRGDVNGIKIGHRTNIQDNATIHGTYEKSPTIIGNAVSIGHNAIVHGCTLEDETLVGMGAIIMDGAIVGKGSIVAAGAVVLEGTVVEPETVFAGIPARKVKQMDGSNRDLQTRIAKNYLKYAGWYQQEE